MIDIYCDTYNIAYIANFSSNSYILKYVSYVKSKTK